MPAVPVVDVEKLYMVDKNNTLRIHCSPTAVETLLMLPVPFFFLGCVMSSTTDVVFRDEAKTVTVRYSRGHFYLIPCFRSYYTFNYHDIASVGYVFSSVKRTPKGNVHLYRPVLIMKNVQIFHFGYPGILADIEHLVFGMHFFVFGRNNKDKYTRPSIETLKVPTKNF